MDMRRQGGGKSRSHSAQGKMNHEWQGPLYNASFFLSLFLSLFFPFFNNSYENKHKLRI
jgi:hypothetical protein